MPDEAMPDDSEPTPERQAELRAAYDANVAAGKAPYEGVRIRTRGELSWVMRERDWSGEPRAGGKDHANLTGADLSAVNLAGATLSLANLYGARLFGANLSGANLRATHMNAETNLTGARLDVRTRLADVVWNGVPVTRLNWDDVDTLGDEYAAWQTSVRGKAKDNAARLRDFQDAVRANRQVATLLRSQGLNEPADRFAYRAQVLQRQVLRRQRQGLRWLGSGLLDTVAGYGYRPARSVYTYVLVVLAFAALYFGLGGAHGHALSWNESLIVSLTAFHGRGFFATAFQPGDPQAAVAAIEAVFGLLIEITFIATFTNRFFAR